MTNLTDDSWRSRLFEDKSLLAVYWRARKVASSNFNRWVAIVVFAGSAAFIVAINEYQGSSIALRAIVISFRTAANQGADFSITTLGFLVAGFALFASITKPKLFTLLAQLPHTKEGITRFQFVFYNFIFSFIHFIAFAMACVFVQIVFASDGALTMLFRPHFKPANWLVMFIGTATISGFFAWFAFMFMLLKSFIWNLYQAILLSIAANDESNSSAT